MQLNEAIEKTEKVSSQMPGEKWGIYQRLADLLEETGELANAIQVAEGWKSAKRKKSEINDSVCDILYSLFLVAHHYGIDLDQEYEKVLGELDTRRARGDFDPVEEKV